MTKMRVLTLALAAGLALHGSALAKPPLELSQRIVSAAAGELKKGEAEAAVRLYESAIVANPASVAAYVGLGKAQVALERPGLAKDYFATAVKIDPNDLGALEAQSLHYIRLGDLIAAEQNINRLKRLCINGCAELSSVLGAYEDALEEKRTRVLGDGADG